MKVGWQTKSLGDVCERVTVGHVGITTPFYSDDGVLFLRTQNVGEAGLVLDDMKYVTPAFHATLKKSEVRAGDVLMSRVITHTVRCALIPHDLGIANCANVVLVRPASELLPEFLAHYIRSSEAQRHLLDRKVGSAQLVVNTTVVRDWPIPVPPIPEQQRIVRILDKAFVGIAIANANAERNLGNARAFFVSHLASVLDRRGDGWSERRLEELAHERCSLSYGIVQPGDEHEGGLPVVRPTDLGRKVIHLDGLKRVDPRVAKSYQRTTLLGGELLLCVRGSTGVVSVANAELAGGNVTRGIVPIRFDDRCMSQSFGYYALTSESVQRQIRAKTYGAALMQINIRDLREIVVPVPPRVEQDRLGREMDALESTVQRLESVYQRKLAALDDLKKSLLHQAFSGQL